MAALLSTVCPLLQLDNRARTSGSSNAARVLFEILAIVSGECLRPAFQGKRPLLLALIRARLMASFAASGSTNTPAAG
jgi:hypothetical protein